MEREVNDVKKIVENNIKLIYKPTANFYFGNDMVRKNYDFDELLSVATLALNKAAKNFDKSKGYELSTYAVPIIKYSLLEFIRNDKWHYRRVKKDGKDKFETINIVSTDCVINDDPIDKEITLQDTIQDNEDNYKKIEDKHIVEELLKTCSDRERYILKGYFFEGKSQAILSKEFKTSQSFISLVIRRNLKRFRNLLEEEDIYVR